jgi:hypothetical protein
MQCTLRWEPILVSQKQRQLLDGASGLFIRGKQTKENDGGQAKEAELFRLIGRLQMQLEWPWPASMLPTWRIPAAAVAGLWTIWIEIES